MSPDPVVAFPLDYYQILGLPPQCAFGLVESAYTDRVAQAPRREFSAALLAARERLLKDASTVLQDPVLRERYHRDQPAGTLKLEPSELAVGLLFLFELGKYQPILEREAEALKADNQDVRLVLALTHRMLALDAYRQGALSLACQEVEAALSILSGGGGLLGVQQELQALIKRWRPERILQLLAAPVEPENQLQRRAGFVLLSEVLDEREGIEGAGNDQSGLSREEFVQFVQYVRLRLTVAEQLELFEREAARPSPAAQYLAVQALLARGYTACDPPCVRRARGHLIKLAQRQDVYIELALCALLLGQSEEALKNIERSGEQPATEYIANLSLGAPDQLPGLCRYADEWFAQEVLPFFRDLRSQSFSLQSYFASPLVQCYLEQQQPVGAGAVDQRRSRPDRRENRPVFDRTVAPATDEQPLMGRRRPALLPPPFLPAAAALVAVFLLGSGWLLSQRSAPGNPPKPEITNPAPPLVAATPAPPSRPPAAVAPVAPLTNGTALSTAQITQILQDWQQAKQQALGPEHQTARMQALLTGNTQQIWRDRAEQTRKAGEHWKYRLKQLKIDEVKSPRPDRVEVVAQVSEVANFYSDNQLQSSRSYDRPYRVRYALIKSPVGWQIDEMKVVN